MSQPDVRPDLVKRGREELSRICEGKRRWTMTVPVRQDDSDIIFADALDALEERDKEIERLRADIRRCSQNFTDDSFRLRESAALLEKCAEAIQDMLIWLEDLEKTKGEPAEPDSDFAKWQGVLTAVRTYLK